MIEFNLYREDFNVSRDLSFLARILNAVPVLIFIFVGTVFMIPLIITIPISFGALLLMANYLRPFYPDWPKEKFFTGKIRFDKDQLIVLSDDSRTIPIQSIEEMVLFIDHFKGYQASSRDTSRTGNSMTFIKETNGNTSVFKFNIEDEGKFHHLMKIIKEPGKNLQYYREYKPYEIPHILKPDLSGRIMYQ